MLLCTDYRLGGGCCGRSESSLTYSQVPFQTRGTEETSHDPIRLAAGRSNYAHMGAPSPSPSEWAASSQVISHHSSPLPRLMMSDERSITATVRRSSSSRCSAREAGRSFLQCQGTIMHEAHDHLAWRPSSRICRRRSCSKQYISMPMLHTHMFPKNRRLVARPVPICVPPSARLSSWTACPSVELVSSISYQLASFLHRIIILNRLTKARCVQRTSGGRRYRFHQCKRCSPKAKPTRAAHASHRRCSPLD